MPCPRTVLAAGAVCLAACSPSLDWREVRPEGSSAQAMFPCKPDSLARGVPLAGETRRLTLFACTAGDVTWALSFADVGDPARVSLALEQLRQAAATNADAEGASPMALAVRGATPNPQAGRWLLAGRLRDGRAVQMQVAVFARGTVVYQATALGPRLDEESTEEFFGELKLP